MTLLIATPHRGTLREATDVKLGWVDAVTDVVSQHDAKQFAGVKTYPFNVVLARNLIANVILQDMPYVDNVLWWDDDLWPSHPTQLVRAMLDTGLDLVSAPYTTKTSPARWAHNPLRGEDDIPIENGCIRVRSVGFGFVITSRKCLETISAASFLSTDPVHRAYTHVAATDARRKVGNLFGHVLEQIDDDPEEEMLVAEDRAFCKRWRDLGGTVNVYAGPFNMTSHGGAFAFDARMLPGRMVDNG